MLLLHQMVARSEGHEMSIVCRGGYGDRSGASHVGVAELVGQLLQLISLEPVIIPQHMIVARPGGALYALVRAQIEVKLCRMCDANIHGGACRDVPRLARLLLLVRTEEPGVVPLLHHDEGDAGLVVWL